MTTLISRLAQTMKSAIALLITSPLAVAQQAADVAITKKPPDGIAGHHAAAGFALLFVSLTVVGIGLVFTYYYHRRLLETIDIAVRAGQPINSENDSAVDGLSGSGSGKFLITGPNKVTVDSKVTYKATGWKTNDPEVSWTVEGVKAKPSTGDGDIFEVTFKAAGTAMVAAKQVGKEYEPLQVTVSQPANVSNGIVLPFAIQNWGRLVVTILGIGVVSALMAWDVVSAEGGIGLLGALFGIGGSAAAKDEIVKPKAET